MNHNKCRNSLELKLYTLVHWWKNISKAIPEVNSAIVKASTLSSILIP